MPSDRSWWALTYEPGERLLNVDEASLWLYDEGAAGVEWEDGAPAEADWADEVLPPGAPFVRAYFPDDNAWAKRQERLLARGAGAGLAVRVSRVQESDWAHAWKRYYHPVRPGRRIWVVPAWEEAPDPSAPIIRIDPGMAFGTGTHPTTAMMLALLEDCVRAGSHWIDVGSGSGILALGAWLMGARVTAVEPDPVAVSVARQNFRAHGAAIELVAGTLRDLDAVALADGVLANLTASLIADELDQFERVSRPGAVWCLSGILVERGPALSRVLEDRGRRVVRERESGGWLAWEVEAIAAP
jgi:ribosomal protein L11 methyltransferase